MSASNARERMLFTFQSNGEIHGKRVVQVTAEHLLIHEAPVGPEAEKRSWFGSEEELPGVFSKIGFVEADIAGVLAGLRVNRVETREVEAVSDQLNDLGFVGAADNRGEPGN